MRRVVVTGAAGYVGSVLCAGLLARGYEVIGIDKLLHGGRSLLSLMQHREFRFVRADIADTDTYGDLIDSGTMVVHLAAIVGEPASDKMPEETQKTNVLSTRRLIDLAVDKQARKLVFVSTCSNYGKVPDGRMATEDDNLNPLSLYARTKVDVERYLTNEIAESVDWTILRFATVYGLSLRPRFDLTVNDFTLHAITDKKLVIYLPYSRRPYVHVRDAAGALQLVLEKQKGTRWQIFNVGASDANYRKVDIVDEIKRSVGEFSVEYVEKGTDLRDYAVNFDKIRGTLGFVPLRRVSQGVAEIARAIQDGIVKDYGNPEYYNA